MCAFISALSWFSLVGLLVLASLSTGFSQDRSEGDRLRDLRREWYNLAQGRTDFEVADLAQVPGSLSLAAEHSSCRYKEGLEVAPIRFLYTANRRLAIVTCWGPLQSRQRVFDLSDLRRPMELQFPIAAYPDGFSASIAAPGFV